MKSILFLTDSMVGGGAERVISVLSNKFTDKGIKIYIISVYSDDQDYKLNEQVCVIPLKCESHSRILRIIKRIRAIRKTVEQIQPDCVISFLAEVNIQTLLALFGKNGFPIIISERNDPNRDPSNVWIRRIRDKIYRFADGYVFQTPNAQNYFENLVGNDNNSVVIPNPLTPDLPYHTYDRDNRRLITACRLAEQKNLKMMIDSVAEVLRRGITCSLDIFGVGPQKEELSDYIRQLKLEETITLRGFTKDIHREMSESAAFIISSNYEGMSNSMMEAMAIGLPVIATDCPIGGASMLIKDGENGILIPVNDRAGLTKSIIELLENPQKAKSMGSNAVEIRKMLDVDKISKRWIEFISYIINNHKGQKK